MGGRRGTGLGLLDSQEGRLKVWQQERCGSYLLLFYSSISRQIDMKACCPYECYHFKILHQFVITVTVDGKQSQQQLTNGVIF